MEVPSNIKLSLHPAQIIRQILLALDVARAFPLLRLHREVSQNGGDVGINGVDFVAHEKLLLAEKFGQGIDVSCVNLQDVGVVATTHALAVEPVENTFAERIEEGTKLGSNLGALDEDGDVSGDKNQRERAGRIPKGQKLRLEKFRTSRNLRPFSSGAG